MISVNQGDRPDPTAQTVVQRMASTMQDMRAAGAIVTAASVAVWGDYTDAEVAAHAREAADLARAGAARQLDQVA